MQSLEAADETENTFNLYEEFSKLSNSCGPGAPTTQDLEAALFDIQHSGLLDSAVDKLSSHQTNGHLTHQIEEDRTSEHLAHQIEDRTQRLREEGERQEENESEREEILKDLGLKQDGSTQLAKLVHTQKLNYVTLNIYSQQEFSLQLPNRPEVMFPLTTESYNGILASISRNSIPPILYDHVLASSMLEQMFYSGCLIVYFQNFTRLSSVASKYFTLLRRDYASHFKDVNHIHTSTPSKAWTSKELNSLESKLLQCNNSTKLCLDVREGTYESTIRDHRSQLAFVKPSIRRCLRRASHHTRKAKLSEYGEQVARMNYIYDVCKSKHKSEQCDVKPRNSATTKSEKREPDTEQEKVLAFQFGVAQIGRLSKRYERPPDTNDWYPRLVEEYILEAEQGESRVYNKVSVSRRPTNGEFLGQMYVDHEYKEDAASQSGASYRFTLGSRRQTNRYIHQFIEIFTEKGCKSVKLTHVVAGQPAKVSCTKAMQEKQQQQQQQQRKPVLQVLQQVNAQQSPQQLASSQPPPQASPCPAQSIAPAPAKIQPATSQPARTVLQQQLCSQQYIQTSQPSQHITLIQTSNSSSSHQTQLPQLQIQIQQQQQQQQQRPRVIIQNQNSSGATAFLQQISKQDLEAQIQEQQQILLKQQLQQRQQQVQQQQQRTATLVNGVVPSPYSSSTPSQLVNGDVTSLYQVEYQCNSSSTPTIDDVTREQTITAIAHSLETSSEQHQLQTAAAAAAVVKAQAQAVAAAGLKPLTPGSQTTLNLSSAPQATLNFLQSSSSVAPQLRKLAIATSGMNNARHQVTSSQQSPLFINLATSGSQPVRVIPSLASQLSKPSIGTVTAGRIITQAPTQQFTIIGSNNIPVTKARRLSANHESQSPKLVVNPVLSPSNSMTPNSIVSFQTLSTDETGILDSSTGSIQFSSQQLNSKLMGQLQNCIGSVTVPITVSRNVSSPQLASAPSNIPNIVSPSSATTMLLANNSPKNGTKAHQTFRTATIPGAAVRNLIQTGGSQSLQFIGKIQNKTSNNNVNSNSTVVAGANMLDARTVQRLKVTPGSSVMQQFTNPSTGAITYQQFQIQSPVTSPAPKRRKSSIESAGGGK